MSNLFKCNFVKAFILNINKVCNSQHKSEKYDIFVEQFGQFQNINKKSYHKNAERFVKYLRDNKHKPPFDKEHLLAEYSRDKWKE